MKKITSRKALQLVIGIFAAAPLLSGLIGLTGIHNPLFIETLPANLILDSNLRFLNAMPVAVALSFYLIIPVIEKETFACRIICCAIFFGGVGRLISFYAFGAIPVFLFITLVIELASPIIIMYWQEQIASRVTV